MKTNILIKHYINENKTDLIQALFELQSHEYSLSDTRKSSTMELAENYLNELIGNVHKHKGAILIAIDDNGFLGFIAYYYVSENTIFEVDDSNNYVLVSDICVLTKYRGCGVATLLLDACLKSLKGNNFIGRIRINTLTNNIISCTAYEKYGFKPYEITYEMKI